MSRPTGTPRPAKMLFEGSSALHTIERSLHSETIHCRQVVPGCSVPWLGSGPHSGSGPAPGTATSLDRHPPSAGSAGATCPSQLPGAPDSGGRSLGPLEPWTTGALASRHCSTGARSTGPPCRTSDAFHGAPNRAAPLKRSTDGACLGSAFRVPSSELRAPSSGRHTHGSMGVRVRAGKCEQAPARAWGDSLVFRRWVEGMQDGTEQDEQ